MAKNEKGLGRGFASLLETDIETEFITEEKTIQKLDVKQLIPNPYQPRRIFDEKKINELAISIKNHGILQPILVSSEKIEDNYAIIAGERRWRAAQIAALQTVPVILLTLDEEQKRVAAIIENMQREDLNPIEIAHSLKELMNTTNITQQQLSEKIGISRSEIANTIRILSLPDNIQQAIQLGEISKSHARLLINLEEQKQQEMFLKIKNQEMSVKELSNTLTKTEKLKNKKDMASTQLNEYKQKLIEFFGTKVTLQGNINKGNIKIEFYTIGDFSRILEILKIDLN